MDDRNSSETCCDQNEFKFIYKATDQPVIKYLKAKHSGYVLFKCVDFCISTH